MKKFLLFAAACVALVACNQKDNALNNAPEGTPFANGQKVILTVNNGSEGKAPSRKISGTDQGTYFEFKWEANDSILVKVGEKSAVFHIKNSTISADGKSADFEGVMPAEGNTYDVQYPVPTDTDPLKNQTYVEGGIASGLMQFGATGCTSSKITLQPKTAILQLNFYTTDDAIGTELGDPITLGALTVITLVYETPEKDYEDNLTINPSVALETSADKAKPFYMVVRTGVKYKKIDIYAGTTPDKSGANLNGRTFEAGTCIDMPAWKVYDVKTCFAAGTRIMMADGSTKKVEDIVEGDLLRTFDHEAGCISSAKVCLTYKGESKATSLNLTFASGKKLAIVGTHDLLLENTRKYVRINAGNVASFVGKRFYNAESGKWDALVSFETGTKVDYYCIYTAKHLNCIAEGLLTCPDDVDHILNIYELDAKLKANASQLSADIAQYGLFDLAREYPEFAQYNGVIEDLGGKYVYIAIGKGLVPGNHIEQMKSYWSGK